MTSTQTSKQAARARLFPLALAGLWLLAGCSRTGHDLEQANGGDPQRGKQLIVAFGCASCHTISGVGVARGLAGPPLTDIKSHAFVAGVLANQPDNLQHWIMHPSQYSPKTAMPDLGVTADQARDIAAYLYSR